MKWITHKTFDRLTLDGPMTIKRGEPLEEIRGVLFRDGHPVCLSTSQMSKEHFALDGDGRGLERGDLTRHIAFGPPLSDLQKSIIRIDPFFQRFVQDNPETILFTDAFFRASMMDLYTICRKLGVRL